MIADGGRPARVLEATKRVVEAQCYGVRLHGFRARSRRVSRPGPPGPARVRVPRGAGRHRHAGVRVTRSSGAGRTRSCSRASSAATSGRRTASWACARAPWCARAATRVEVLQPARRRRRSASPSASTAAEPLRFLDDYLAKLTPAVPPGLPRFFGGAVGWLGYDVVRSFERLPAHEARRPRACPSSASPSPTRSSSSTTCAGRVKVVASRRRRRRRRRWRAPTTTPARASRRCWTSCARPAPPLRPLDPTPAAARRPRRTRP